MRRYAGSGVKKNSYDAAQEIIISSRYSILLKKYVHVHLWLPKLMIICNLKHSTYYYSVSAIRIRYPMSFKKDVHISIAIMPGFKYSTCFYLQSQSASCPMPSLIQGWRARCDVELIAERTAIRVTVHGFLHVMGGYLLGTQVFLYWNGWNGRPNHIKRN